MTLDPQLALLLEQVNKARPVSAGTPEEGRAAFAQMNRLAAQAFPPVDVASVADVTDAPRPLRVYTPFGDGPFPTLLFIHGGGFVIGDLDSYDAQCRMLCSRADVVVASLDYRLAPEHPFPAAVKDSLAAFDWAADRFEGPLAVGGDSAGGNLSAVVAQERRDRAAAQLLIYPSTDMVGERPSLFENAEGLFLTLADIRWFHEHYLGHDEAARSDPRASPARAEDLSGLPPAIVVTAFYDPLRDYGDEYASLLSEAGVRVIHRRYDSLIHGFFGLGPFSPAAQRAADEVCDDLRSLLHV